MAFPGNTSSIHSEMEDETQGHHYFKNNYNVPTRSPTSDKFISSLSVVMLILFFLILRSSASPFLNPSGEARKAASSSVYFNVSSVLYIWVISSTVLTITPHFGSTHNNGVIAAALFFPMLFSSIAALLFGRFLVRSMFYLLVRGGFYQPIIININAKTLLGNKGDGDETASTKRSSFQKDIKTKINTRKAPKMIPFHRPFRKLAKSAAIVSVGLSFLHAHCWSRTLSIFKVKKEDNAGAICRAIFSPFVSGTNDHNDYLGADEYCIWIIWGIAMLIMIGVFFQDEKNGLHCRDGAGNHGFTIHFRNRNKSRRGSVVSVRKRSITDDDIGYSSDENSVISSSMEPPALLTKTGLPFFRNVNTIQEPVDTLPMVPWLSLFAMHSLLDIFISFKIFMGRVDARLMQPALKEQRYGTAPKSCKGDANSNPADFLKYLQEKYPGCIYDYSSRAKPNLDDSDGGFWFDFMADCGDGFNSSYQIARLLAQPLLQIMKDGKHITLPRGEFLVNGGDLAYPEPTEQNFEKRFFRTFEDAMQPPPSFRRTKIAINKEDICIKGWDESICFDDNANSTRNENVHEKYKGPSTFIVPGNHDWYDGLATFTRFILCRDFLGGWLMPQQRSYFAIKLVKGWWIFGLDCALAGDIDIEQFKFFADIADNAVGPSDAVILVNHEPHWVTDYDNGKKGNDLSERNITELAENHLRGKVRCRLAGDLHHYTRHVPVSSRNTKRRRRDKTRSHSVDRISKKCIKKEDDRESRPLEPFTESNKPHLIVAGGGGAFMHGTNAYDRDIKVGPNMQDYTRISAYPNEVTSSYLGWLNMYQFRSRGWRCDLIFAVCYLGIVSSLFPLCGGYDDYDDFNPDHDLGLLFVWLARMVGSLILRMVTSEWYSLLCLLGLSLAMLALQAPEHHVKPIQRYFLALGHAFAHITAALSCLIFVQCVAEWAVKEHIVTITSIERNPFAIPSGLAGSIYVEYRTHFYPLIRNFTHTDSPSLLEGPFRNDFLSSTASLIKTIIEFGNNCWDFLFTYVPLLKTTLKVFDLPSLVAQNHHAMCSQLCANDMECFYSHDSARFQSLSRSIFAPYVAGITLYYIFIAVPLAGTIFGTWLAVSLNIFKSQCDLAFSSLQIQDYKNFVKLRITNDGELEVYGVGLRKVPRKWTKDPDFDVGNSKRRNTVKPSWSLMYPSKWVPVQNAKAHMPQIIDYCSIPKRRIRRVLN